MSPWSIALAAAGGAALLLGCGLAAVGLSSGGDTPAAAPSASTVTVYVTETVQAPPRTTAPPTSTSPPPPAAPEIREGIWTVGVDFPAGTYRTVAEVGEFCYWEITPTGSNGGFDIIDNDIPGGGRPTVTLQVGWDFKTNDCGTWAKVD